MILFSESSRNMGGQEWQLLQQMAALQAQGEAVALACRPDSRIVAEAAQNHLQTVTLPFRNSVHAPTIWRLRQWMRQQRVRACVCHSSHDSNNVALAARLLPQWPRIVRSRTYLTDRASAFAYNHLADATMLPSEFLRQQLLAQAPVQPARLHTVYPGIDFDRLQQQAADSLPEALQHWLAQTAGPLLVLVGMWRPEKGQSFMLSVLARLRQDWPNVRLVLAGAGVDEAALRAQVAALGLADAVWLGEVRPIAPLLRRADVLVMPSRYEPLGMVQIEALGLAVPVVVSDTGGIPETVRHQHSGLLCPPDDEAAWLAALTHALTQPEHMQQMALTGQADVRQRFGKAANTEALRRLLRL